MRRPSSRSTLPALVAGVVACAAVLTLATLHPARQATHHAARPFGAAPRSTGSLGAVVEPAAPTPAAALQASSGPSPAPPTTVAPSAGGGDPCPVQPLAGDGVWPVVDGSQGSAVAPSCGIVTNVEVPSRTQWITVGSPTACTWTTYADPSADPGSVIATRSGSGPALMAFTDAVAAVRSQGCGAWAAWPASDSFWLGQPSPSTEPIGDGTRAFWLGIADGTWQASGGPDCHWEVLRGFTGTAGDVVDAGSSTGATSVTMAMAIGGDQTGDNHGGFSSQGCGTWIYVGGATIG